MTIPRPDRLPMPSEELLGSAVFAVHARCTKAMLKRRPFWSYVGEVFCTGSGYSQRIADACGYDPDTGEPRDAAPASGSRREEGE